MGTAEQSPEPSRALEQVRRPRTTKPADQRRREILHAACELIRARGFEATAVQAIADRADVAAGTVYALVHFTLDNRTAADVVARQLGRLAGARDAPILDGTLTSLLADVIRTGQRLGYVHTSDANMTAYLLNVAAMTAIGNALAFEDEVHARPRRTSGQGAVLSRPLLLTRGRHDRQRHCLPASPSCSPVPLMRSCASF